jgi:hypothetical protein
VPTVRRTLAVVAVAWGEHKGQVWKAACDRVAMGFIVEDPDPQHRVDWVIEYRKACLEEEKRNERKPVA